MRLARQARWYRLLGLALLLAAAWGTKPTTAAPSYAAGSGIAAPVAGEAVGGVVTVRGAAQDADFAKWQLDLLPGGDAGQAVFLALGETAAPALSTLTQFDSARFTDGAYSLRLRVVRRDGNYDEHVTAITIANRGTAAGRERPAAAAQPRLASRRAAALGLPTHSQENQPILYLTFDDGPSPTLTPQIVDLLDQYDARATFFVIGVHVRRAPAALRPAAAAGHALANHTLSHKSLAGRSQEAFAQELQATEEIVAAALGDLAPASPALRYLRPPGGGVDANTGSFAEALGYQVVGWDIDPKDWRRPGADAIASFVLERAFPGAIVVLHDGGGGSQQTVAAVETILRELGAKGYVFHAMSTP